MAQYKLRKAKEKFLLDSLVSGNLITNKDNPSICSTDTPVSQLIQLMDSGELYFDSDAKPVQKAFTPMDLIAHSHYGEFPDTVVTLKLAEVEAKLAGKDSDSALRKCAGAILAKINNQKLQSTVRYMKTSRYPGNSLISIENTIKRMAQHLSKELGTTIYAENEKALSDMLFQPRK